MTQPTLEVVGASPRPRRRRWLRRLLVILTCLYLLCTVLLYFAQDSLIFPGSLLNPPSLTPTPDQQLLHLPAPAGPITALYSPAPSPDAPTILYFYGNGECLSYNLSTIETFHREGFNILIPDYPGYGLSPGHPSAAALYQTADACYAYLTQSLHIPPSRIAVVGRSLGGAPAVYLASKYPVGALATLSAFRTLGEIAGNTVHHLFPTPLLVRHHLDNLSRMRDVHCPVFIAHGTDDDRIPFDSASSLAHATTAPTTLYPVPHANHNDLYDIGGQPLNTALSTFLHTSFSPSPPQSTP